MKGFLKEADELGKLYSATGEDWELEIHHILTEPTCPTIIIRPEGWNIARYRFDCNSLEEGLKLAVERIKNEVLDRKVIGSDCPFTEGDDATFDKWLRERAAGSNAKLPRLPS